MPHLASHYLDLSMNLSQQQIDKIKEYARALTSINDVAVLMDLDIDEFREEMSCKDSPIRKAYESGRAQTEYDIRTTEINMAANGSPLAIQHVKAYINDLIIQNDN